jgi:hypothetical protein
VIDSSLLFKIVRDARLKAERAWRIQHDAHGFTNLTNGIGEIIRDLKAAEEYIAREDS